MADSQPPKPAAESTSSLVVEFTNQTIARAVHKAKARRAKGTPEQEVFTLLEQENPSYDAHTLNLLRHLIAGGEIEDDFPPASVLASAAPKPNVAELKLSALNPAIKLYSMVRYQKKNWLVLKRGPDQCLLKLMA